MAQFDMQKSNGETLRVESSEFKGKMYIQIRNWYTDEDNELRPTKKGVSLNTEQLRQVIDALTSIADELGV